MINTLFANSFELEILVRLLLAGFCGFAIGYERTKHLKNAGIRTYVVVAIGAAIFTIISKYGFLDTIGDGRRVDVARVACNIVTGVSFLGAGTICLKSDRVTGLTTAAGIWVMAAIGMAFGAGMYVIAGIATAFIVLVQNIFQDQSTRRFHVKVPGKVELVMDTSEKSLNKVISIFDEYDIEIDETFMKRHKEGSLTYAFRIHMPETLSVMEVVSKLYAIKTVQSVNM